PPGDVHRGVLGGTARPGDPDTSGPPAARGRRVEGGTAGGPARRALTHAPRPQPSPSTATEPVRGDEPSPRPVVSVPGWARPGRSARERLGSEAAPRQEEGQG